MLLRRVSRYIWSYNLAPVQNSVFADGTADAKTYTTNDEGVAAVSGDLVVGGTYTVKEAKAPAGYELSEGSLTFTLNADGTITTSSVPTGGFTTGSDNMSVTVEDTLIELGLVKENQQGMPLSGARFAITGVFANGSGEETRALAVGTDGKLKLLDLVGGQEYQIVETRAPTGYKTLTEPFSFTVELDGTLSAAPTSQAVGTGHTLGYYITEDGLTLVAVDALLPSGGGGDVDDPDKPSDPDDPVDPDEPTDPDDPATPDNPSEPGEPENPEEPSEPNQPNNPATPATPGNPAPETPDTGDHTSLALPVLLVLAGVALVGGARR